MPLVSWAVANGFPAKYRKREEVDQMREQRDPIDQSRGRLVREHGVAEDELKKIDAAIREEVNAAAEFAQTDPEPDASELTTDVLVAV